MKKYALAFLMALISLLLFSSLAFPFGGPLQVKNQFPLFLTLNPPYLETASYDNSLSISLSHSSIFMVKSSPSWSVSLDMELTELNLRYKKDIGNLFEIGFEIPLVSFNSGFMDSFLDSYHKTFGFPDYGRSNRPNDEFFYEVKRNEVSIIKGEGGRIGLGDVRLFAKRVILNNDPALSLQADLAFPTGDASKGFGSGSFDTGISILIDKKLSEKVKAYGSLGVVFPGDLKGHETVKLKEFVHGGAGVEAGFRETLSLLGQVLIQTSPFPKTGISSIDRISVLLSIGGRYSSGKNSFELSFTEDPNTSGAPDFTLSFSFKKRF